MRVYGAGSARPGPRRGGELVERDRRASSSRAGAGWGCGEELGAGPAAGRRLGGGRVARAAGGETPAPGSAAAGAAAGTGRGRSERWELNRGGLELGALGACKRRGEMGDFDVAAFLKICNDPCFPPACAFGEHRCIRERYKRRRFPVRYFNQKGWSRRRVGDAGTLGILPKGSFKAT